MRRTLLIIAIALAPATLSAQEHAHTPGMTHPSSAPASRVPTLAGQDAYGAIAEIVAILEADSTTDWSRVNLEVLRQHLIDMNAVTLGALVRQREVPGGIEVDVTGEGRVEGSIRRMVAAHTPMLDGMPDYVATGTEIPGGARFTVRAGNAADARAVAKVRGLGFIGLLTVGAHHAPHHLSLARGELMAHGH